MTLSHQWTSRTAALTALGVAIVVVVGFFALFLVFLYSGQREEADENLRQLAAYRSEIDARDEVERAYTELKTRVAEMPGLVHAEGGAPAAAQVQTAVKEIVEANGGEVRSAQVLPSTMAKGFEVVSLDCDMTVPASHLRELIYAVETHRPYLFIDSADITAPVSWDRKNDVDPTFEVRWDLRAYRWTGAK